MWIDYTTPEQLPQLKSLWHTAFGDSMDAIDAFFATGYAPNRSRCITEAGKVLCVLYWLDVSYREQKMAYIYAVATDPAHRGKGLFRKLSEDTRRLLAGQGYAAELLMPGDAGLRQMYAKLGYTTVCFRTDLQSAREDAPSVPITPVSAREYAALRPTYAPPGTVTQEGENMDYLATYAEFYRGEDFLLAAVREEGTLFGLEFLGEKNAIPGILSSLNCQTAKFRTPGKDIPTAMSRPLKKDVTLPEYMGFLFD